MRSTRMSGQSDCTVSSGGREYVLTARMLIWLMMVSGCRANPPEVPLRDAGKSVTELRPMLADTDPEVQARGALGLSLHGSRSAGAIPELIPLLKNPNSLVRQNAALALGAIGAEAKAAVPALTDALKDPEWTVRRQAALALGNIGPDAKPALPVLKKLDTDPHPTVRTAAKDAQAKMK